MNPRVARILVPTFTTLRSGLAIWVSVSGVVVAQETAYRSDTPAGSCTFEAAKLYPSEIAARGGRVVEDADATSGGRALEVTPYKMEGIYFGFTGKQPPVGQCTLTFRMKVSNNTKGAPAFYLAAYDSNQREFALTQKLLSPGDFAKPSTYQDFSVSFVRKPDQPILAGLVWKGKDSDPSTLTVDTVSLVRSAQPLGLGSLKPDRLWYRRGAPATLTATVANHTDQPQQTMLKCALVGDVAEARAGATMPITLQRGEVKDVTLAFNVGRVEWGAEVRASLVQSGREIASASDVIAIAGNPYKVCEAYGGIFGVRDTNYAKSYLVPRFREGYVPVVEYFSWAPGMWADMSPEEEEWLSGQGTYRESKTGLRTFVELCHQQGIAVVTYAQTGFYGPRGFDWAREHPEWLSYDRLGRPQAWFDIGEVERQRDPRPTDNQWYGTFGGGGIWVANMDAVDYQAEELVKASEIFGFDGVRWDGHPIITTASTMPDANVAAAAYDYQARPISDLKDGDGLSSQVNERIITRLKKAFPSYIFGYNWAPEFQGVVWPQIMPKMWKTLVPDAYLLDEDLNTRGQEGSADPNNLWTKYAKRVVRSVDWVKPYGGYHYSGAIVPGSHVFGCHMMAVLYAAGSRAAYVDPHSFNLDYAKFALRYGELIFDNSLLRSREPERAAKVTSPNPTWWQDYVYTRSRGSGKSRTVVHVLNPPVKPYLDYKETQPPAPQENVAVTAIAPTRGALCKEAWILSPDSEPFAVAIKPVAGPSRATVNLPRLRYWTMVVYDWTRL